MARRPKSSGDLRGLLLASSVIVCIPLVLVAGVQYLHLGSKFRADKEGSVHLTDTMQTLRALPIALMWPGAAIFIAFCTGSLDAAMADTNWLLSFATLVLLIATHSGRWLGTQAFGVLVDREGGIIVLPQRVTHFPLLAWATLAPIWKIVSPDTLVLDDISRLTRRSGRHLYLHGPFGSRTIVFSDKQFRDQMIMELQDATGRRLLARESEFA